jgi:hypothetical protein
MAAADQILQWGDLSRLRLLWESDAGRQIRDNLEDFARLVARQWSRSPGDRARPGWDVIFGLVNDLREMVGKDGSDQFLAPVDVRGAK